MNKTKMLFLIILISVAPAFTEDTLPDDIIIFSYSHLREITFDYSENGSPPYSAAANKTSSNIVTIGLKNAPADTLRSFNLEPGEYLNITIHNNNSIEQDKVYLMFDTPIHIPGICKTISSLFCVYASNNEDFVFAEINISAIITDCLGIEYQIPIDRLQGELFYEYTVAIPTTITQRSIFISDNIGITLKGFVFSVYPVGETLIEIGLMNITAVTDVFAIEYYDTDEIRRGW